MKSERHILHPLCNYNTHARARANSVFKPAVFFPGVDLRWARFPKQSSLIRDVHFESVYVNVNRDFSVAQIVKLLQRPRKRVLWEQKCHNKMWGKDLRKRNALSCWRKIGNEGDDWTSSGKEFQRTDAATGNERRLTVDRRNGGTCSSEGCWGESDTTVTTTSSSVYKSVNISINNTSSESKAARNNASLTSQFHLASPAGAYIRFATSYT